MKCIIVLFLTTTLFSCSSLKPIDFTNRENIQPVYELNKFNGKYALENADSSYYFLDSHLFPNDGHFNFNNPPDSNDFVLLEATGENKIKAMIYDDGKIIKEKTLKGKLETRYFLFNRQFHIPLFTLVFNVYRSHSARIALLKNENLIIDSSTEGSAMLVLIPILGAEGSSYNNEYKKLEN